MASTCKEKNSQGVTAQPRPCCQYAAAFRPYTCPYCNIVLLETPRVQETEKNLVDFLPYIIIWIICLFRIILYWPEKFHDKSHWVFFESANLWLWIPILALQACTIIASGTNPFRIKTTIFWSSLLTSFVLRCLTSVSYWATTAIVYRDCGFPPWASLIFSPWALLSLILCNIGVWKYVYLGRYLDIVYDKHSRTFFDFHNGAVLLTFGPKEHTCGYYSWRDEAVRLEYLTAVENVCYLLYMRFLYSNGPYTANINNSELVTMLLVGQMVIYTIVRRRTWVKLPSTWYNKWGDAVKSPRYDDGDYWCTEYDFTRDEEVQTWRDKEKPRIASDAQPTEAST